jgi:dienelactone hydrolase
MLQTSKIEYVYDNVVLEGYCALDDSHKGSKPAVLVAPDWSGRNDFACQKAEQLAEMGYVGFALDMYGAGKSTNIDEEKQKLMKPLANDRALLRGRVLAAFHTVRSLEVVNGARIGIMGYCFGGMCALDLARSGAEIRGAVSFHGTLNAPDLQTHPIHAKLLVLHGFEDPHAPPSQVSAFEKEMTDAGVDWQIHIYGHTQHAFTNPRAHDPKQGLVYNSLADRRSWISMRDFFLEVFS